MRRSPDKRDANIAATAFGNRKPEHHFPITVGRPINIIVIDSSSDNLTFEWDFGDSSPVVTSTYHSGGTFPFIATDTQTHVYSIAGIYDLKVRVTDDDGGLIELSKILIII